jgi:hypothetical protein
MPTISTFLGISVAMYWQDHPPPHIHVFYGGSEALIEILTGEVIAGRVPPGVLRVLRSWVALKREFLLANWQRARNNLPLEQIPGADQE